MTENLVFLFISLAASGATWYLYAVLRASGLRERRMRGFSALCFIVPFWILLTAIADVAEPDIFRAMFIVSAFPLNAVPYITCWFILNYTESKAANSRLMRIFLIAMPSLAIVLLLTNPWHNLYYLSFGNPPVVGPAFTAHLSASVSFLLVIYAILFRYVVKNFRSNPFLIVGASGAVIPIAIYIVYIFLDDVINHDYTPIGYFFAILIVAYASYRTRLRNARPGIFGNTLVKLGRSPEISNGIYEEAARLVAKEGCLALGAYRVKVRSYDEETNSLKCVACYNSEVGDYTDLDDFNMQGVADFNEFFEAEWVIVTSDVKKASEQTGIPSPYDPEVCAILMIPIRVDRHPVGSVCIEQNYSTHFPERREWSSEEQSFAASLAELMAIAAVNAERHNLMRQLQEELSQSNKFNKAAIKNAPIGLVMFSGDFELMECNDALLSMLGVTREQFREDFFSTTPEYQPGGLSSVKKMEAMRNEAIKNGKVKFEWMHHDSDGEPIPCEVTIISVEYGDSRTGLGYIYDLRDVARLDKDLHVTTMQLKAILENYPGLIFCIDNNESVVLFDGNIPRKAGIPEGQFNGRKMDDVDFGLVSDEGRDCVRKAFSEGLQAWTDEFEGKTFRALATPIFDNDGDAVYVVGSVADITEIAQLNSELEEAVCKANEANRAKTDFLAKMSHEIRTPMNAILGIAEIQLHNESIPAETEEALEHICDSGSLLLNIINDILDFSKIEAGKLEVVPVKYDISSLINDTVQINRLRYDSKPIEFFLEIDADTPLYLSGDELRLKQILGNILSNAFKYTDEGEVRMSVYPEKREGDVVTLVFRISDTGHGMTKEQVGKLFTEYTRFNTENNRTTGTGLGLSITKRIVELMGGEMSVKSKFNKGSEFTVRLPQRQIGEQVCGREMAEKLNSFRYKGTGVSKRSRVLREYMPYGSVLIVDDVKSNIYVAKGLLTPYGLQIDTADSGFAAIEKIKAGSVYDIIFMDQMMPKMSGIEAVKILRDMGYKESIVALTANAIAGQAEMFLENGFDGYITKPIDSRELNDVLNKFIRNKKPPEVVEEARQEKM